MSGGDGIVEVALLVLPNVIASTIVVTDASGVVVYVENVDYTVTVLGDRVQLRRLGLPNNSEVLVDYSAVNDPSSQSLQLAQAVGARFELFDQHLAVYYRYQGSRYPYATPGLSLELIDEHLLGVDFELPPVEAGAEYEHHGSSVLPYDALRARQGLALSLGDRSRLSLQGSESLVHFAVQGLSQGFLEATARYDLSAGRFLSLSAAGGYRLQAETGRAPQPLWSAQAGLLFRRGRLTASAQYSFLGQVPGGDHALTIALTRGF